MRMLRWLWAAGLVALIVGMAGLPARAESDLVRVPGLDQVKVVATAGSTYAALRADGSVWIWDIDADGVAAAKPHQVNGACRARSVAVGLSHLALVCADGGVWLVEIAISEPGVHKSGQVPGLDAIKAVAVGREGMVALRSDGTVWVAGMAINTRKQLVENLSGVTAIAASVDDFVAIRTDGTAWTGRLAIKTKGTGAKRVEDISSARAVAGCGPDQDCDGADPFLFITTDGQLVAKGIQENGIKRTLAPTGIQEKGVTTIPPTDGLQCSGCISMGHMRVLSVTASGDARLDVLAADGKVTTSEIRKPGPALKQVAAGSGYDIALAADGTVWMWAAPSRPSQVPELKEIAAIASGGACHLALGANGKLYSWGYNGNRQVHELTHVPQQAQQIAASTDFYAILNTDGSITAGVCPAAGGKSGQQVIHRDLAARYMAVGDRHVIILKFDGQVAEAGVAITDAGVQFSEFRPIPRMNEAVQVAAGESGYLVLRGDGTVWGARWSSSAPQIANVGSVPARAIAAGGDAYAVLLGDGSVQGIAIDESGVHVWGDPHVSEADSIAAGGIGGLPAVLALQANGTVTSFSRRVGAGQVTDLLGGIAVAAGERENLLLKADGTVWSWRAGAR